MRAQAGRVSGFGSMFGVATADVVTVATATIPLLSLLCGAFLLMLISVLKVVCHE